MKYSKNFQKRNQFNLQLPSPNIMRLSQQVSDLLVHLCTLSLGQRKQLLISVGFSSMFDLSFGRPLQAGLMVAFGALIKTLSSKLMVTVRLNLFITNRHGYIICLNWTLFLAVCSRFFEWDFFLKSLNLANEGQVNIISANIYQSCQVVPGSAAYYNYQLENKWVGINLEMFKVEKTQNKLFFKVLYLKFFK